MGFNLDVINTGKSASSQTSCVLLVVDAILVELIIVTRMLTWMIMLLAWLIERHDDRRMKG